MPECYTHARIATKSLMRSGVTVASQPAFMAGANGPDPLYMYGRWKRKVQPDLPALATKMHRENTGDFLVSLLQYAITPVQQSYAMGFLTHYTTDCTLHPYIAAMAAPDMPYEGAAGRRRMEASLDSTLYYADYKSHLVPLQAGTPVLISEDLAQVTTLLHETILATYGEDIPALALADTFHDNLEMRRFLISRTGLRKAWVGLFPFLYPDKRGKKGGVGPRMQPAKPLKSLPVSWENPFTREELNITLEEVLTLAEQTGAVVITAAMRYWLGEMDEGELRTILNDNNYYTGLPCKAPEAGEDGSTQEGTSEETEKQALPEDAPGGGDAPGAAG